MLSMKFMVDKRVNGRNACSHTAAYYSFVPSLDEMKPSLIFSGDLIGRDDPR